MRVLFTLQYLGARYAGWQRQANAVAVQEVFEEALARMFGKQVRTEGAGRTDAGVHARAQRVHADLPAAIRERGLVLGLNNLLPGDIRVTAAVEVDPAFHARFDATGKRYRYQILNASVADVFLAPTHALVVAPLDAGRMQEAAAAIVGQHDFRSFTVAEPEVSSTVRTVESIEVRRNGNNLTIDIRADGFLRYMVRRLAGSLIRVGRGETSTDALARALEPSFEIARWTAPAHGLILEEVIYPDHFRAVVAASSPSAEEEPAR